MDHSSSGVKTITCQKGMLVLLLQKIDNRREVGFLAAVFDIFRRRGVSVDLVATSETTTTLAINKVANLLEDASLAELVAELETHCTVTVYEDCVCVNLVGRAVRTVLSRIQSSMAYFDDQPLLMLSLSANDLCLSLLMPAGNHEKWVHQLHHEIISQGGPSWEELQRWK
jgi:aspartokinase